MGAPDRTLFEKAVQLSKRGDHATAHKYMRQVLLEDPTYVPAWLWMSALVGDDIVQQRECLERALALDPQCEPARRGLEILRLRETVAGMVNRKSYKTETTRSQETTDYQTHQRQARKLGEYLVEQHLISEQQLAIALSEQQQLEEQNQGIRMPLGNILIKNGMLTPQKLATVLVAQQQDKLHGPEKQSPQYLGEYLVAKGIITAQQLEAVLAEQIRLQQQGTTILTGELLVYAGYISPEVLETVLAQQLNEVFNRFGFER